jgi:hypothetical protein
MNCSICNTEITGHGHNPTPVTSKGRCCDKCNIEVVVPKRIKIISKITEDEDDQPEMPEGGWECSECGNPVNNMNDYCSQSCFNAGMM